MIGRSWVEIDLNTIVSNYKTYSENVSSTQEIMAVVKADAYGHGGREVATALQAIGCKHFAVSNIEEAILLREANIVGQILILGYTPVCRLNDLVKYDITQAIISEEYANKLKNLGIRAQIAIDTGMNRIGLDADNAQACEDVIRKYAKCYELSGLFTHLCVADTESEKAFTKEQIEKFRSITERVSDLHLPYIHCMNSAGGLYCKPYGNLIRLGIVLYGLKPDYKNQLPQSIKPALSWKSVISMIKVVRSGETIGYGRTYSVEKDMVIATIPAGYADGYNRLLSNKGKVIVNGRIAPIVGRVCMDQLMIDVTDLNVNFEDEVTLIGDGYSADDMARDIGTIGYEVICDISKRVPKVYV